MTWTRDIKNLHNRAGGECSYPACEVRDNLEEAHILAQGDGGPRADRALARRERDAYENLLLLCPNHHTEVDGDPVRWSAEVLRAMKATHEADIASRGSHASELSGDITVRARGGDKATGADLRGTTRILPGTRVTVEADGVREVTGVRIGGSDDGQ
jgi:hypothetical protein